MVFVEGIKCLSELESPILIDLCCYNVERREGHREEFSYREMKFCMKTEYIWNCQKDWTMKEDFKYVTKELCVFQYNFSKTYCRK